MARAAVLLAVGALVWYAVKPPSPEKLYQQAQFWMDKDRERAREGLPRLRGVAQPEEFNGFRTHATTGQVIAGDLASHIVRQDLLPSLGNLLMDFQ